MEIQTFDLLWLPDPIETCLHDGTLLNIHEVALDLKGLSTLQYSVTMAQCPACNQWYGLLPLLREIAADAGWEITNIDDFVLEDEVVTAGVYVGEASLPWSAFCQHMTDVAASQRRPTPSANEVKALDQRPTTWEVGQGPATWIGESEDEVELGYVALVHDTNHVRAHDVHEGTPMNAEQLAVLIRRAAGAPLPSAQPGRPRIVRIDDEAMADDLRAHLSPLGIKVEVEKTPLVDEAIAEMALLFMGESAPPVFAETDEASICAFLDTASRFYDAEPWTRLEGDRFVGVQVDDAPWFFVNAMGQMGESPGLSLFEDWLTVCRFIHNEQSPIAGLAAEFGLEMDLEGFDTVGPFEAAGSLEALSLDARGMLHPADAHRLDNLGIDPPVDGQYPVPRRFDVFDGPVPPHFDLHTYRVTMEALLIALERRRATPVTSIKTTLDIDGTSVTLRYPSEGTERPYAGPPGHRLVVHGHDDDIHSPSRIPEDTELVIEASATTLFKDVAKALGQFDDRIYEATLMEDGIGLWNDRNTRRNPSPRVADLAELDLLELEIGGAVFAMEVDRALDTAPEDIQIQRASG